MSESDRPVLVMCARAPPQIGGTPTVMYELLRHFPKGSVIIVSKVPGREVSSDDRRLEHEMVEVGRLPSMVYHPIFQLLLLPLTLFEVLFRVRRFRARPRSILAVFPSVDFLLISMLLSKLFRVPVFPYLHNCIVEIAAHPFDRAFARLAEVWVFKHSAKVYSMSEPMRVFYGSRGFRTEVLPHGVDRSLMRPYRARTMGKVAVVGFSGIVYETNVLAVKELLDAKKQSGGRLVVKVSSPRQSLNLLASHGLLDGLDMAATLGTRAEVLDFLASCDMLFIPMSFESKVKKDLLTIFPTKVTDYWLAQRPMIVYGPDEYAFVGLAGREGYALAVTERGPEAILAAVESLSSSEELGRCLVEVSRRKLEEHDARGLALRAMKDLGIPVGGA